jgi:hypothetical protein
MLDFNAKVDEECGLAPNFRKYKLHKDDFALTRNMAVSSIMFQHKSFHLQTWRSPDGSLANEIDCFD